MDLTVTMRFLFLFASSIAWILCATAALSQDGPRLTVPEAPAAVEVPAPAPELQAPLPEPQAVPAPAPTAVDHRYWIVSSRELPQKKRRLGNGCPLDFVRVDCPGCVCGACAGTCNLQTQFCPAGEDELIGSLVPGVPVCIVVHGSNVTEESAVDYSWKTFRWLRSAEPHRPLHMIYFTWPSDPMTYLPNIDFNVLGRRSSLNAFYLSRLLHRIPAESPVCLLGHSHGTRTISALLHLLGGGAVDEMALVPGSDRGHRIRVVFAASAIDHDWLNPGERYGRALCRTEGLLTMTNRHDWALGLYPLRRPFSSRALARTGFTSKDERRLGSLNNRICELDVTRTVGKGHTWPHYFCRPELAVAISPYVYFSDDAERAAATVSDFAPASGAAAPSR